MVFASVSQGDQGTYDIGEFYSALALGFGSPFLANAVSIFLSEAAICLSRDKLSSGAGFGWVAGDAAAGFFAASERRRMSAFISCAFSMPRICASGVSAPVEGVKIQI